MAVLFYQIGIFIAIQISASFGKNSRNVAVALISVFTILQVFTSGLMLLQFITIFLSYSLSNNWFFSNEKDISNTNRQSKKTTTNKIAHSNIIFKIHDPFYDDDDGFSSVSAGGISKETPILMNCEESRTNYIQKLLSLRSGLSVKKKSLHFVNNHEVEEYHFYYNNEYFAFLFVSIYSNHSIPILPAFFTKDYFEKFVLRKNS